MRLEDFSEIREALGLRSTPRLILAVLLAAPIILFIIICAFPFWLLGVVGSWASAGLRALRGVGKTLNDPVFGTITYEGDSSWGAERDLEALGGRYSIQVTGSPTSGPGAAQHELLRGFIEHLDEIRRQVQESLYREYQALAPQCRKYYESLGLTASLPEDLPFLEEPAQIWGLLSDGSIMLEDQPGCFLLSWNCTWDMERGVSRSFLDWKLQADEDG
jgi:hypothetical protein